MATQAHARGADEACARRQAQEVVDGLVRVLVVRFEGLEHITSRY